MLNILSCPSCYLYILLCEMSVHGFWPFSFLFSFFLFFFNCWVLRVLYILKVWDTSLLSGMWFINFFSQNIAFVFVLLIGCFRANRMFLIFTGSNCSVFPPLVHALGVKSKNSLPRLRSQRVFFYYVIVSIKDSCMPSRIVKKELL